ncbi:MAG: Co2+/Mg2+ efflux protein ApaG [Pseudomonadota bacterium]
MSGSSDNAVYESETEGVLVRVRPRFLDDQSEPTANRYIWAYDVEIENRSDRTLTLTTRHWRIVDSKGHAQHVDGEGVVGQTPRLAPGEAFQYTSGAPLAAPSGFMSGSYDFLDDTGALLSVAIPAFSLDSPFERSRPS